jgi:hypothetical protein
MLAAVAHQLKILLKAPGAAACSSAAAATSSTAAAVVVTQHASAGGAAGQCDTPWEHEPQWTGEW